MDSVDIAIVGAGVVGLAVARELSLSLPNKSILVLEQHDSFGQETSSRNSEVIHGGMYYATNSLKAKLCVEGRRILYELCAKHKVPHRKTTKIIVASQEDQRIGLEKIYAQGQANGVEGLKMLTARELAGLEPNVKGVAGLYSAETGIIDSHQLMKFFHDTAVSAGAMVVFNCTVTGVARKNNGYLLRVENAGAVEAIGAQTIINCAGLDSDTLAGLCGIDLDQNDYRLSYCKGQYFRVAASKSRMIQRLVYPVPKPKSAGLGVHATLDLAGSMRLGPDEKYLNSREKDYGVDKNKCYDFYMAAKTLMPFITAQDLTPDTCGIRPKLQKEGGDFRDFIIREESDKDLPGLINLIGIESPGLTASPAIAKHVRELMR